MIISDKIFPQALDSERVMLGSMLLNNDCMLDVTAITSPAECYRTAHVKIFQSMIRLEQFDVVSLTDALQRENILEELGGTYYLTELVQVIPSSADVLRHAKLVHEKYLLRRIIEDCSKLSERAYNQEPPEEILEDLGKLSLLDVVSYKDKTFAELIHESNDLIDQRIQGHIVDRKSGLRALDGLVGGFSGGKLIVIAGWSSQGKTALMNQIVLNVAVQENFPVVIFELEMTDLEITQRIVAAEAKVCLFRYFLGKLNPNEHENVSKVMQYLPIAPIIIDEHPGATLEYIKAKCRRLKKKRNIGMICIDYLQLMELPHAETEASAISKATRGFKNLAKELNVPIVVISQFSKDETRSNKRPNKGYLKGSSAIEQDGDIIIFPWLPDYDNRNEAVIIIDKHRNGPTGEIKDIRFNTDWIGFEEKEHRT